MREGSGARITLWPCGLMSAKPGARGARAEASMEKQPGQEVTALLKEWAAGDRGALERLMPLVYEELRRLAGSQLKAERRDHTLQPTALVHEAYLRLVGQQPVSWTSRAHFFGIAGRMMRQVLIDHARKRRA